MHQGLVSAQSTLRRLRTHGIYPRYGHVSSVGPTAYSGQIVPSCLHSGSGARLLFHFHLLC